MDYGQWKIPHIYRLVVVVVIAPPRFDILHTFLFSLQFFKFNLGKKQPSKYHHHLKPIYLKNKYS